MADKEKKPLVPYGDAGALHWFTGVQLCVLQLNSPKSGWEYMTVGELKRRLKQELGELDRAIEQKKSSIDIIREAADVANFAMFLANVIRWTKEADDDQQ